MCVVVVDEVEVDAMLLLVPSTASPLKQGVVHSASLEEQQSS